MRKEAAFSDFIANGECTGPEETKKAAPFGATLFKEANGGNQRKLVLTPLWETGTDRVRVENIESEVFQTGAASSVVI
jgi:hypothetical protein